jgi:N-acyl-D-aspartate/D-glutamate deacylase
MYDLVIRGGRVVDGSGKPAFEADVALIGDRVAAVGPDLGPGREELDARGKLVTPGWVDMHTHYDGQVTWDPFLSPSGHHGVTTVVMGNCGVGFAPCKAEDRKWLVQVMEGVEDIPGTALHEGIQWSWETFPEYLNALEAMPRAVDVATQVPHSAVRAWVMGVKRSEEEQPTAEEIAEMAQIVEDSVRAGALGFTTSRTPLHKSQEGVLVSGTHATIAELDAMADALAAAGAGVFEVAEEHVRVPEAMDWMTEIARRTRRPVLFSLSQTFEKPELWREVLRKLEAAAEAGLPLYAQCAGRAVGILLCWQGTVHPFTGYLSHACMGHRDWSFRLEKLRDPAFRAKLLTETPVALGALGDLLTSRFDLMFPMRDGADYEPRPEESVAAIAAREGRSPQEVAYDLMMERDGEGMLYFPLFNYADGDLELLRRLHSHPRTLMGLSDGGAHCGAICDGGMPTFMLTHWARDRDRGEGTLPLEWMVHRQTQQTAAFYGLHDRGLLAPGYRADVNVIDYEGLRLGAPRMVRDLPAGGRRLLQDAEGYVATICAGTVTFRDGQPTGSLPGRLVRGAQAAPAQP